MFIQWIFLIFSATLVTSKWIPERIAGGHSVSIKAVPWQASLLKNGISNCGAVIYSERVVITAAHCDDETATFSVRVGSTNPDFGGQVVKVLRILKHEDYGLYYEISHDIAVIKLQTSLRMGAGVRSIPLANSSPPPGSLVSVSGWGRTGKGKEYSDTLLETTVSIVDQNACREAHYGEITKDMICAAAPGRDSCKGDSGGPLVFNGTLVGIVSYGRICAHPNFPGVYANVAELKPWILNAIRRL
ncbi:trypsin delta-like [Drosophila rhopaloa]|uniref:trypsin n=1 Tax=Drosophila rhopaloa TaxID=1041015 RepID=A0A6P4E0X3_DRORH|nr:trypsin delta-like [Drosophila rhopaloa]